MKDPRELTVGEVADAIGIRPVDWAGKCFEVASKMVDAGLVDGEAVYGHWTGPVSKHSRFSGREGAGFVQHGWVLLSDGETVVDPTRWVFEAVKPYIFVGEEPDGEIGLCKHCGHMRCEHDFLGDCNECDCPVFEVEEEWPYDEGGNRLRDVMRQPCPEWNENEKQIEVDFGEAHGLVTLLTRHSGPWTLEQLHWLVTLPYGEMRGFAYEIYRAVINVGWAALIPIDNRNRAEREHAAA